MYFDYNHLSPTNKQRRLEPIMQKIKCPHCNQTYDVDSTLIGQKMRCSNCNEVFIALDVMPSSNDTSNKTSNLLTNVLLIIVIVLLSVFCLQLFKIDEKISYKSNPIIGYKMINYTWEEPYEMQKEFKNALDEGYEPVGYVCQNSIKGGFFLFVNRAK